MKEFAQIGLLVILSASIVFHVLVLAKIVPYKIVWGSRLKTDADMYKFEAVSVILNVFFLFIALLKANFIKINFPENILNYIIWGMVALFLLNTVGNLLSKNSLEKKIFTPITILLMIFLLIIALSK
jgi:membrane protease YdiL (CAAX protease family)